MIDELEDVLSRWAFIRSCFLCCQLRDGGYHCQECGTTYESPRDLGLRQLVAGTRSKDFTPANATLVGVGPGTCGCGDRMSPQPRSARSEATEHRTHKEPVVEEEEALGSGISGVRRARGLTPSWLSLPVLGNRAFSFLMGYPMATDQGSTGSSRQQSCRSQGYNGGEVIGLGTRRSPDLRGLTRGTLFRGLPQVGVSPRGIFLHSRGSKAPAQPHFLTLEPSQDGIARGFRGSRPKEGAF